MQDTASNWWHFRCGGPGGGAGGGGGVCGTQIMKLLLTWTSHWDGRPEVGC